MANLKREYSTIKPIAPKASTSLFGDEEDSGAVKTKIVLRDEQKDAVEMAFDHFCKKSGRKFLWNAKMRFGKTFCALELARRMSFPEEFLAAKKLEKYRRARRTLIVTHRPVLKDSWRKDFYKIFGENPAQYQYGSRFENESEGDFYTLEKQAKNGEKNYIFFVSMQYIRLSNLVGGDSDDPLKKDILNADWDLIVVDEAHEGTQTERGKNVISYLTKENTKVLHLTGTAYNLYDNFSDSEIYTWDYVMEQQSKKLWKEEHPHASEQENPYFKLPAMELRAFNLGELAKITIKDNQAFSFIEFFRTYQGMNAPKDKIGRFVHEEEVKNFLDLMCTESEDSYYPFSTEKYRDMFRHTLWIVPGVKEATALKTLLENHEIFGQFDEIINVAGKTEDDIVGEKVVQGVLNKMGYDDDPNKDQSYLKTTITISCSRLTTGVTVPPWTAVFYMKGSVSTNVGTYMQTIFRVQSGWEYIEDGVRKTKQKCYVFDFAPDRALLMMAKNAANTTKYRPNKDYGDAETTIQKDRQNLDEQLELFPVLAMNGGQMVEYNIEKLFAHTHENIIYDRIAERGFNDDALYDMDAIDTLTPEELEELEKMGEEIGKTEKLKGGAKPQKVSKTNISQSKLTPEERRRAERAKKKKKEGKVLTPEEQAAYEKEQQEKAAKRREEENRLSNIRAISLRIPLLMFGGKLNNENEELTLDNFTRNIDDESWKEFMPRAVDKPYFNKIKKLYNMNRFNGAGRCYREWTREADGMTVEKRIQSITEIFDCFHNPDKETVLTPWEVVNRHMSETLGGWCFCNEHFDGPNQVLVEGSDGQLFDMVPTCMPRFVDRGEITAEVFRTSSDPTLDSHILEINSKTGKYPLYVAYSLYRNLAQQFVDDGSIERYEDLSIEDQQMMWDEVLKDNVYVLCNTPMAEAITRRTLRGFRHVDGLHIKAPKTNEPTIVTRILTDKEALIADIKRIGFWNGTTSKKEMKFNAIVSNPPYQGMNEGNSRNPPIYHHFFDLAFTLSKLVTLITPGRFLFRAGQTPKEWMDRILADPYFRVIKYFPRSSDLFPAVEIKGGILISYRDANHKGEAVETFFTHQELQTISQKVNVLEDHNLSCIMSGGRSDLKFNDLFLKSYPSSIQDRIRYIQEKHPSTNSLGHDEEYELRSSTFESIPYVFKETIDGSKADYYHLLGLVESKRVWRYIERAYMTPRYSENNIDYYKVFVPGAMGNGIFGETLSKTEIGEPGDSASQTFISMGRFETLDEAVNCAIYIKTKFLRCMLGILKKTQANPPKVWANIPLQDFTSSSDIDWSKSVAEIDQQLYDKYGLSPEERDFIESMIKPME